jgi:hypothetical protein
MIVYKEVIKKDEIGPDTPKVIWHSENGKVLTVGMKDGDICVWYLTDNKMDETHKYSKVYIMMTGEEGITCNWRYLNTIIDSSRPFTFVLHGFVEE